MDGLSPGPSVGFGGRFGGSGAWAYPAISVALQIAKGHLDASASHIHAIVPQHDECSGIHARSCDDRGAGEVGGNRIVGASGSVSLPSRNLESRFVLNLERH